MQHLRTSDALSTRLLGSPRAFSCVTALAGFTIENKLTRLN